eukprot:1161127-Pelagomonas_calceolata.AAC.3
MSLSQKDKLQRRTVKTEPRQEEEEAGVEGGMGGGEGEGEGSVGMRAYAAGPGRRLERVKKPQLLYQLRRDVNAAWNLWEVRVAKYLGHPRPGYRRAHTTA